MEKSTKNVLKDSSLDLKDMTKKYTLLLVASGSSTCLSSSKIIVIFNQDGSNGKAGNFR